MTTATAHALLKAGKDKLAVRALIGAVGTLALLPFSFFVPLPTLTMLPWLAIACVLHTSYPFVLIRSYEANDFAVAYSVARGVEQITNAIFGVVLLGDSLTVPHYSGI